MTTHISFDLETWGTEPGCDIRSIGACVFDPVMGDIGDNTFYLATDNPPTTRGRHSRYASTGQLRYPLRRDPVTVKWWEEQSDEAQAAFEQPVELKIALNRFTDWLYHVSPERAEHPSLHPSTDIRLWSHGPAFDPPILAAVYKMVGLPVPWHYRTLRDTRTIFDAAGIDDHSAWLREHPGPLGVPHHALDDAICQARAVCAAWSRIRDQHTLRPIDAK